MDQDLRKVLRQRKQMLDAQIMGCYCSLSLLEARRLTTLSGAPAETRPVRRHCSRGVIHDPFRTLIALAAEHFQVQRALDKLDQVRPDTN